MSGAKRLFIIRGFPGAGKSTLAEQLSQTVVEADDYFLHPETGEYEFDPSKLRDAHQYCKDWVRDCMAIGEVESLVVSNTFTQLWEMQPYLDMAEEHGYQVTVLTVESGLSDAQLAERNIHGCPAEKIAQMRERWQDFIDVKQQTEA